MSSQHSSADIRPNGNNDDSRHQMITPREDSRRSVAVDCKLKPDNEADGVGATVIILFNVINPREIFSFESDCLFHLIESWPLQTHSWAQC